MELGNLPEKKLPSIDELYGNKELVVKQSNKKYTFTPLWHTHF